MAITELFYDNKYINKRTIRNEKSRLYRCVDKKGNFLWWEWICTDDVLASLDSYYETTSGFADFSLEGTLLELADDDKERALKRIIKL